MCYVLVIGKQADGRTEIQLFKVIAGAILLTKENGKADLIRHNIARKLSGSLIDIADKTQKITFDDLTEENDLKEFGEFSELFLKVQQALNLI